MELKDFVAETLTQITKGVEEAQNQLRESNPNACINPHMTKDDTDKWVTGGRRKNVEMVDFDVAVTVKEGTETKGGMGLVVAGLFNLETGGKSNQASGTVSRVRFKIPAAFPMHRPGDS